MPAIMPNSGLAITTSRLKGEGTEPKYVHWGTGITAPQPTDIGLETPRNEARVEGVSSRVTTNTTNDTYQVVGTLTAASGPVAITEAALFDAAGAGSPPVGENLYVRGTFAAINLEQDDSIQFTIQAVYDQAP